MTGLRRRAGTRRDFVKGVGALAGSAALLGYDIGCANAEPPPETTRLRLFRADPTCLAPQYVADEFLHAEGFTDVRYVKFPDDTQLWVPQNLLSGEVDIALSFIPQDLIQIDAGQPVVILGGIHNGCVELVARQEIKSIRGLKGKTVATSELGSDEHVFISLFAAYVGLDPHKDINWVLHPHPEQERLLTEGKIDALFTGPPESFELRQKKIGHVLVSMTTDKPWAEHFCCLVASTKDFVQKYPVATKRVLRALLKATDVCATDPKRVARYIADKGRASYDYTLQTLRELPYGKWREYDAEAAMRFYALRMHDVGMLKNSPQKIIAQGSDFRFLNELKRELKA